MAINAFASSVARLVVVNVCAFFLNSSAFLAATLLRTSSLVVVPLSGPGMSA